MFYFGCHRETGHFLWKEDQRRASRSDERSLSFNWTILDACLFPVDAKDVQGEATITHFMGWTVISFWDRSVDKRPMSNSSFVVKGHHSFDDMVKMTKEKFPWVWSRFSFEVKLRTCV